MKTIRTNVYTFNELSGKAKEKARDWFRQCGLWDGETTIEDAKTCLAFAGFDVKEIHFSGFSSQGDGAQFEGTWKASAVNAAGMKEHAPQDAELHRIADALAVIAARFPHISFSVKSSGHYSHEYCTEFDFSIVDENSDEISEAVLSVAEGAALEKELTELARDAMRWIYKQLNADYDWYNHDEQIDENITANEYTFTKDGKRFG